MPVFTTWPDEANIAGNANQIDVPTTGYMQGLSDVDWFKLDLPAGSVEISILPDLTRILYPDFIGDLLGLPRGVPVLYAETLFAASLYQRILVNGVESYISTASFTSKRDDLAMAMSGQTVPDEIQFLDGRFTLEAAHTTTAGSTTTEYTGEYYLRVEGQAVPLLIGSGVVGAADTFTTNAGRYIITTGNPTGQRSDTWGTWVDAFNYLDGSNGGTPIKLPGDVDPGPTSILPSGAQAAVDAGQSIVGQRLAMGTPGYHQNDTTGVWSVPSISVTLDQVGTGITGAKSIISELAKEFATELREIGLDAASDILLDAIGSPALTNFVDKAKDAKEIHDIQSNFVEKQMNLLEDRIRNFGPINQYGTISDADDQAWNESVNQYKIQLQQEFIKLTGLPKALGEYLSDKIFSDIGVSSTHSDVSFRFIADFADVIAPITGVAGHTFGYWGGAGRDVAVGADLGDFIYGGLGNDSLSGGGGGDTIGGGDGDDTLKGDAGNDKLYGGPGADIIYGGLGFDTIDGGTGRDTAVLSGLAASYTITRSGTTTTVVGADGTDTLTSIEVLKFDDKDIFAQQATSDFNGDGKSDVIWRNDDGSVFGWQMNGLQSGAQGGLGKVDTLWHIEATGDFDADGKSDLLWRNENGGTLIWTMNGLAKKGEGNLGNVDTHWNIAGTGDFNGDGKSDILWRNNNGDVFIYAMNGTQILAQGGLGRVDTRWQVQGTGDFDGDGKSDILWRNDNGATLIWTMNGIGKKGEGNVGAVDTHWHVAGTGDFDGDGKSDILWRNDNGDVYIYAMNGTSIKSQGGLGNVNSHWNVEATGDYDGDGKSDILWRNDNGAALVWAMNGLSKKAEGNLGGVDIHWHVQDDSTEAKPHSLGNFDADGKSDILLRHQNGDVFIWTMNGLTKKAEGSLGNVDGAWHIAGNGDFDGDGKSDILFRNDNGNTFVWELNGIGKKAEGSLGFVDTRWSVAGTGDFDGDGKSDLLWHNDVGATAIWELNGLAKKAEGSLGTVDPHWQIAGTGDFDGDGKSDVLWRNDSGELFLWEMNGLTKKAEGSLGGLDTTWNVAGIGDFDGDGKSDILLRHDNGNAFIWEMNGLAKKAEGSLGNVDLHWEIAATGDVDGDSKADIVWHHDNGAVAVWEMNGFQIKADAVVSQIDTTWHIV